MMRAALPQKQSDRETIAEARNHTNMVNMKDKARASAIHLALSMLVAAAAALLVFGLWFPGPYRELAGGRELFLLVVGVDVVIGPVITFVVFNRAKRRREIFTDFAVIGLLQLAALGYGMWTVYEARPVHLVFEYHRLAVVHAADLEPGSLQKAPSELRTLPLTGPTLLSLRPFKSPDEEYDSTMAAIGGVPQAMQPALWQPWEAARADILREAKPVAVLRARYPAQAPQIDAAIAQTGRPEAQLLTLPLLGRKAAWTVLLDTQSVQPVAFLPLDSF